MMRILTTVIAAIGLMSMVSCSGKADKVKDTADTAAATEIKSDTIRLNCFIKVSAESRDSVLSAAKRLTEASLKQDGCISYDVFESGTRPEILMICETWRDQESLDAHSASEVFKTEVGIISALAEKKTDKFNL